MNMMNNDRRTMTIKEKLRSTEATRQAGSLPGAKCEFTRSKVGVCPEQNTGLRHGFVKARLLMMLFLGGRMASEALSVIL